MQLGMIGLGRMGGNIVRRLAKAGHTAVVYDERPDAVTALASETGAAGAGSLQEFVAKLERPRTAWVMLPAGAPTEVTIGKIAAAMEPGDTIIDGGNSLWKDDVRRAAELLKLGIHYLDVRHLGRRLGAGARLLHDDRRRQGDRRPARPDLRRPRAGHRRHPAHDRAPGGQRSARRARLHPCRAERGGPFRQDDP